LYFPFPPFGGTAAFSSTAFLGAWCTTSLHSTTITTNQQQQQKFSSFHLFSRVVQTTTKEFQGIKKVTPLFDDTPPSSSGEGLAYYMLTTSERQSGGYTQGLPLASGHGVHFRFFLLV